MFRKICVISAILAVAFGQTCNPDKVTAPCEDGLPCQTGETCDTTNNCCADSDLLTSTVSASSSTSASTATGSTVSSGSSSSTSSSSSSSSSSTCADKLNPATGVSDCPARSSLCNDSVYYDVMTRECPKTCGRCSSTSTTASSGSCVDLKNPKTGVSDCPGLTAYCNDSNYVELMRKQCPKTCGFCGSSTASTGSSSTATSTVSSGTCVDKTNPSTGRSDCAANKALCNDSFYVNVMRSQCPKTCGFC